MATSYGVTVYEASGAGAYDATRDSFALLAARPDVSEATFTYTGDLNFSNVDAQNSNNKGDLNSAFFGANAANITNYQDQVSPNNPVYGKGSANFNTLDKFMNVSGSSADYAWGSLYEFQADPGSYGGLTLTITHDDGVSVYANGIRLSGLTASPTSVLTETVVLPTATTRYSIVYARENGTPSVLQVVTGAVPEPSSWAMFIGGFGMVGGAMRRRKTAVRFA
jgi:hypothetical protein